MFYTYNMAINFIQKRKTQKHLIFVFIGLFLITTIILWQGFLKEERISSLETIRSSKIKINFETLKNPILQDFQSFKEIVPFEGEIGRENPFIPYK